MTSKRKKILYIHDEDLGSGKANVVQVLHMCKAFAENGVDVTLAIPSMLDIESNRQLIRKILNKECNYNIVRYKKISLFGRLKFVGGLFGVLNMLRDGTYDIYYMRNALYAIIATLKKYPTYYEAHHVDIHLKNALLNIVFKKLLIICTKKKSFRRFISISYALSNAWKHFGVPQKKMLVLHDGCEVNNDNPLNLGPKIRKIYNIPEHKKIIIYAGSLYKNRGVENILRLARIFKEEYFIVIGGPNGEKEKYEMECKINNLNNILFIGHVPHYLVREYLGIADVLLMIWSDKVPTINYCSPMKMFEYMASGKIIVGHCYPTISEVLTHKKTAFLSSPGSFDELKFNLMTALKEKYPNKMANMAQDLAKNLYSWNMRAEIILKNI